MQIKTTLRFHLTPVRMATVKGITINAGEDASKQESLYTAGGECKLAQPLWKAVWRFLKKLKIELLYDPVIPLLGIYQKEPK
jgi:hypothetical protein